MLHLSVKLKPAVFEHARKNLDAGYLQRIDGNIEGLSERRAQELAHVVLRQMEALRSAARPVVVLDPVAEVLQGDESKSPDMRAYIGAGRLIQRVAGALVIHVHHTGHSATDRERGSSTLPAAMFVRYQLQRENRTSYEVELHCWKHKAGAPFRPNRWRVLQIELMPDAASAHREPITGVVLELLGDAAPVVTQADVQAEHEAHEMARLVQAYRQNPKVGGKLLRELLGCGGDKVTRQQRRAVQLGLLQVGGGSGRAGYSLTDAGRALADHSIGRADEDDDLLG